MIYAMSDIHGYLKPFEEKMKLVDLSGDNKLILLGDYIDYGTVAGDKDFHEVFFDGQSHYYIDGTVSVSGRLPLIMVDTDKDKYYQVTEEGKLKIEN